MTFAYGTSSACHFTAVFRIFSGKFHTTVFTRVFVILLKKETLSVLLKIIIRIFFVNNHNIFSITAAFFTTLSDGQNESCT